MLKRTSARMSPRPSRLKRGIPWPASRKTRPFWVPAGIRRARRPLPPSERTATSPPSAAVVIGTSTGTCRSSPRRSKTWVLVHVDDDEEVAVLSAVGFLALAGELDPLAVADAGRDGDLEPGPGGAALQGAGGAVEGLAQRDVDVVLDVAAAGGLARHRSRAAWPAGASAEEVAEEVAEIGGVAELLAEVEVNVALLSAEWLSAGEPAKSAEAASLSLHLFKLLGVFPLVTPLVVGGAPVRVAEDVVGGVDLFEAFLGLFVAAGDVGVVLTRESAIGGGDLLVGGVSGDAEGLVEVKRHGHVL